MKKILVVGGGNYQVPLIKRIRELGLEAYCADKNRTAPGFREANGYRIIDILNQKECLDYAKELKIDGVATYGATITLPTVSFIGECLNLPALSRETAEIASNKYQIKKKLIEFGCNTKGKFAVFHSIDEMLRFVPDEYPCVVKPSDGSGSKGVVIVQESSQYEAAVNSAFEAARFGEVYVENFFRGEEYSAEAFIHNNAIYIYSIVKTNFVRYTSGNTGISYGHTTPPGIDTDKENAICEEIKKAIRILDINMGSVNFDVILSENGRAYIIDCGIRVGQNLIASHIIPLARGVNEMDMYISQVLGEAVDPEPKKNKCIATKLLITEPGIIEAIEPMEQYIGTNGILAVVMRKKPGDIQRIFTDKSDNCGWVICGGNTVEEAERNAENARIQLLKNIYIKR